MGRRYLQLESTYVAKEDYPLPKNNIWGKGKAEFQTPLPTRVFTWHYFHPGKSEAGQFPLMRLNGDITAEQIP